MAGVAPGAVIYLALEIPTTVPAPQSEQHTPVSPGTGNNWELSLSIQRICRGAKWLETFPHGTERACCCLDARVVGKTPNIS